MAELRGQLVILVRDSREVRAIVVNPCDAPWRIHELSREGESVGEEVVWKVIVYLPSDRECVPLIFVFESAATARRWAERDPRAREYNWDFLNEVGEMSQAATAYAGSTGNSLVLYKQAGATAPGDRYTVPPNGVPDWRKKGGPNNVPEWTPTAYSSTGQSHMTGHDFNEARGSTPLAPKGSQADTLPFEYLDSAYPY
jgi:hypothetical protein